MVGVTNANIRNIGRATKLFGWMAEGRNVLRWYLVITPSWSRLLRDARMKLRGVPKKKATSAERTW